MALTKAQLQLSNVSKEKNTKLLVGGEWQWVANPEELRKAQEEVDSATKTLQEAQLQQAHNNRIREKEKLISFEEGKLDIIDDYLDEIKDIETDSYTERLSLLDAFVASYNAKMSKMGGGTVSVSRASLGATGFSATGDDNINKILQQQAINSAAWHNATPAEKARLAQDNIDLQSKLSGLGYNQTFDASSGTRSGLQYANPTTNNSTSSTDNSMSIGNVTVIANDADEFMNSLKSAVNLR